MTKNDKINEKFTWTKQKNPGVYKQRSIDKWLGRDFEFNYINTENKKPSLPCPVERCICDTFSKIFNKYLPETRSRILSCSRAIKKKIMYYHGNGLIWI